MKDSVESYGWDSKEEPCSQQYIEPAIIEILKALGASSVLDLGCGNGALARQLSSEGFDTVGCDADEEGIEIANKTGGNFKVASVYDDPKAQIDREFDAIISTEVIEHLYRPAALPEFAHSLVKSGGHLVVTTPYHGYVKNLVLSLLNKWDTHADPFWDGGHIKFFSRKTLEKMLEENGFRVVEFRGLGRMPFLWKSMLIVCRKN